MKKAIILFNLLILTFYVYGNGSKESLSKDAWFYLDKDKTINLPVKFDWKQGASKAVINRSNNSHTFSYMVYKENDVYKTCNGTQIKDSRVKNALDSLFTNTPKNTRIIGQEDPQSSLINFIGIAESTITLSSEIMSSLSMLKISGNEISLRWVDYSQEKNIDCILIEENRGSFFCMRIEIDFLTEFFGGERNLFATVDKYLVQNGRSESYTYVQKAIGFLGTLYEDEIENHTTSTPSPFVEIVKKYLEFSLGRQLDAGQAWNEAFGAEKASQYFLPSLYRSIGFWNTVYSDFPSYQARNFGLEYFQNELKKSLLYHFTSENETMANGLKLPYMNLGKDTFEAIYSNSRNIYTMIYTSYCFKVNKPVLSFLIQEGLTGYYNYDYTQYEALNDDSNPATINSDGEKLSEMALRYLTWGVEYTPYTSLNKIALSSTGNAVYASNYSRFIKDWVETKGNRNSNYIKSGINYGTPDLGSSIADPAVPKQVHYLNIENKTESFYLISRIQNTNVSKQVRLARIDVWNSENFAWQPGRINEILIGNSASQITDVQKQYMLDRKISKGVVKNLQITRKNPDAPIEVGYKFSNTESLGGILLVRGYVDDQYWASGTAQKNGLYEIEYVNTDGTIVTLHNTDFDEYVTDPKAPGRFLHYGLDEAGQVSLAPAGSGTAMPYYSRGTQGGFNEHVTYSYFIPKVNVPSCRQVILRDRSRSSFLNVSEMCVFNENPLPFGKNYSGNIGLVSSDTKNISVFGNGNFNEGINISEGKDVNRYNIILCANMNVKNLIVWEENADPTKDSVFLSQEFQILSSQLINDQNLTLEIDYDSIQNACDKLCAENLITTPFVSDANKLKPGNPLPFANQGIDCPRTFAYKMSEQVKARNHYRDAVLARTEPIKRSLLEKQFTKLNTTRALDGYDIENYNANYVSEIDIFKTDKNRTLSINDENYKYKETDYPSTISGIPVSKPFLPGIAVSNPDKLKNAYNSLYCPDKVAGIDSLGLLIGSLSMAGIDSLINCFNQKPAKILDGYYQMNQAVTQVDNITLTGLGSDGKPVYYPQGNNSFLNTPYRIGKSDLERCSILVPDIHFVQKGDLLVKYNPNSETPHIGIVVGFLWTEQPPFGCDIRDYWNKVIVLSIREGFQHVTLGTWGSNESMFGGFTVDPESYHIRRLLKLKSNGNTNSIGEVAPFEIAKEVQKLAVNVKLPDSNSTLWKKSHWIPLHKEKKLSGLEITIKAMDLADKEINLRNAISDILPMPPRDFGFLYDDYGSGKSNLLTNQGCGLRFYANVPGGEDILLSVFERNMGPEFSGLIANACGAALYKPFIPNQLFIQTSISTSDLYYKNKEYTSALSSGRLFVRNGKLIFKSASGIEYDKFSVSTDGDGLRGDDYLLRFALKSDPSVVAVSPDEQFLSVMDDNFVVKDMENTFDGMMQGMQNIGHITSSDYASFKQAWNSTDGPGDKTDLWLYGSKLLFHDKISGQIASSMNLGSFMDNFESIYTASGLASFLDPSNEQFDLTDEEFAEKGQIFDEMGNEEYNRGKQPHYYYTGTRAHDRIGQYYARVHSQEDVRLNRVRISTLLKDILLDAYTNPKAVLLSVIKLMPDIANLSPKPRLIYEIKPVKYAIPGVLQMILYLNILNSELLHPDYGLSDKNKFIPGPVGDPGTIGVVAAAGGYVVFAAALPGLILYQWIPVKAGVVLTAAEALQKLRQFLKDLKSNTKLVPVFALLATDIAFISNTLRLINDLNSYYLATDFVTPYLLAQLQMTCYATAGVALAAAAMYLGPEILAGLSGALAPYIPQILQAAQ
jgi:hypothetical protein